MALDMQSAEAAENTKGPTRQLLSNIFNTFAFRNGLAAGFYAQATLGALQQATDSVTPGRTLINLVTTAGCALLSHHYVHVHRRKNEQKNKALAP